MRPQASKHSLIRGQFRLMFEISGNGCGRCEELDCVNYHLHSPNIIGRVMEVYLSILNAHNISRELTLNEKNMRERERCIKR